MSEKPVGEGMSIMKNKLIFLLPSLAGGGAERVAAMLLPFLSHSFGLTLALLERHVTYGIPAEIKCVYFSGRIHGTFSRLVSFPFFLLHLVRLVRRTRADAVLSFMEEANILNVLTSMLTGHKAILSQRIVPHMQHAQKGILGRLILEACKQLYPKGAQILTVSKQIRKILVEDFGVLPKQVTFVPNPVDISSLSEKASVAPHATFHRPYLLHVGRLRMSQKGQDIVLKAFCQIKERWPDLSLVLAGEGPDRQRIEAMISELGLDGRVVLTGWLKEPASFMARAEAFILCSRYEGWPNVLVEAMACGCPVVASDCESGPREIIGDDRYGVLVPVDDPEALARAIRSVLEGDPTSRKIRNELARARAREFSTEQIGPRYVELIARSLHQ